MPLYLKDKLVSGTGAQGSPGKSAYEAAKEGGYIGTEAEFNQILTSIPEHIANMNNPHGVTAPQVGAYTKDETNTLLQKKAPAGYGLGTGAVPIDDYNNAVNNGWYRGGTNYPSKINFANYGMVRVDSIGQIKFQTFYAGDTGNAMISPLMAIRETMDYGATWSEWEYVNPPMLLDEEYRTTERYLGKPVYVKVVNLGNYPASGTKTVAHKISNVENIVSCLGTSSLGYSVNGFQYVDHLYADTANVHITVNADVSKNQVKVMLKYTKTTD